jgi:hypothetical protein
MEQSHTLDGGFSDAHGRKPFALALVEEPLLIPPFDAGRFSRVFSLPVQFLLWRVWRVS